MSVFKIAWRSIQHRGLGSVLTILSMALGVMMVVAVLTIHGLVSQQFKSNSSFGYNVIVGARGGEMQLTMNSVFYLSKPVENIPYEYYLAFCDEETRAEDRVYSISNTAHEMELDALRMCGGGSTFGNLVSQLTVGIHDARQQNALRKGKGGLYSTYTGMAIPLCLGDYLETVNGNYRCVGTKPEFFSELVLDLDTEEKLECSSGKFFEQHSKEHGYFECVLGGLVADRGNYKVGDVINPTHGDPASQSAHLHVQGFTIVGILERTGTPHDRAVYMNMEGFFLMEDHTKEIEDDSVLKNDTSETFDGGAGAGKDEDKPEVVDVDPVDSESESEAESRRTPLPVEQREVTAILVRTNDEYGLGGDLISAQINEGKLERALEWSAYRPVQSQKAAQACNPIRAITTMFSAFVDPMRWLLLALTLMICVVSAISILVGIYNSMNQRRHEIAVMRALGAGRSKVMWIMLTEALLLALAGGVFGWIAGHGLNAAISPIVEAKTGVGVDFWQFAPGIPILSFLPGSSGLIPDWLLEYPVSPELLLIPGLMLLAVLVGIYPAITAYRTDVAQSLGK